MIKGHHTIPPVSSRIQTPPPATSRQQMPCRHRDEAQQRPPHAAAWNNVHQMFQQGKNIRRVTAHATMRREKNTATREKNTHTEGQPRTPGMTMKFTQATRDGKLCMGATVNVERNKDKREPPNLILAEALRSSPAHRAGVQQGDRTLRVNGKVAAGTLNELQSWWKQMLLNKQITLLVARPMQGNTSTTSTQSSGKRNRQANGRDPTANKSPPRKRHQWLHTRTQRSPNGNTRPRKRPAATTSPQRTDARMTPQAAAHRAATVYRRTIKAGKEEPADCPYYVLSTSRAECKTNMADVKLRCEQAEAVLRNEKVNPFSKHALRAVAAGKHPKCAWCDKTRHLQRHHH